MSLTHAPSVAMTTSTPFLSRAAIVQFASSGRYTCIQRLCNSNSGTISCLETGTQLQCVANTMAEDADMSYEGVHMQCDGPAAGKELYYMCTCAWDPVDCKVNKPLTGEGVVCDEESAIVTRSRFEDGQATTRTSFAQSHQTEIQSVTVSARQPRKAPSSDRNALQRELSDLKLRSILALGGIAALMVIYVS